ncbi:MAG: hypothetical protein ACN6ON_17800 [Sphingobacterium sp.]
MKYDTLQWFSSLSLEQKRYLFLSLTILCVFFLIIGIRAWVRMFVTKEIACFPFLQEQATFVIPKAGYYTVYIHGKLLKAVPTNWLPDIRHIATNEKVVIKSVWLRIQHTDFDKGRDWSYMDSMLRKKEIMSFSIKR